MLLTRKRAYYLLRELECVSCRTKVGTRIFVNGERFVHDQLDVSDDATIEAFCINCAHKAPTYTQNPARKAHVDEAIKLMYLREAANMPTRYDAYRNAKKEPISYADVFRIMENYPCTVCGRTDRDFERGKWEQAIRGYVMWPDQKESMLFTNDPYAQIDKFRDCVWLCPEHAGKSRELKLSFDFDENFYRLMRSLYFI